MNPTQALLQAHFDTLVADPEQWRTLIADELVWELPYAPGLGHPSRLNGRDEVQRHVDWFVAAVEDFRFYDLQIDVLADPGKAVAQVKAEGRIKSTGRLYRQSYVVFVEVQNGRLRFIREYFDPIQAAHALGETIR